MRLARVRPVTALRRVILSSQDGLACREHTLLPLLLPLRLQLSPQLLAALPPLLRGLLLLERALRTSPLRLLLLLHQRKQLALLQHLLLVPVLAGRHLLRLRLCGVLCLLLSLPPCCPLPALRPLLGCCHGVGRGGPCARLGLPDGFTLLLLSWQRQRRQQRLAPLQRRRPPLLPPLLSPRRLALLAPLALQQVQLVGKALQDALVLRPRWLQNGRRGEGAGQLCARPEGCSPKERIARSRASAPALPLHTW